MHDFRLRGRIDALARLRSPRFAVPRFAVSRFAVPGLGKLRAGSIGASDIFIGREQVSLVAQTRDQISHPVEREAISRTRPCPTLVVNTVIQPASRCVIGGMIVSAAVGTGAVRSEVT